MSSSDSEGPKLVWTFPLLRAVQNRSGILNIGSNIGSAIGSNLMEVGASSNSNREQQDDVSGLEDDIDSLKSSSEQTFSDLDDYSQAEGVVEVEIVDGAFVPQRTNIEPGETVEWINNDDSTHSLMSIEGNDFSSGPIESGETYEHTFDSEGVVIYIDSIEGGDEMSGAIIVGDVRLDQDLPSEKEVGRELFTSGPNRSMSQAAEEKQMMKEGAV